MENKRKSIHYGFVIIICCCLMMGVNIGLSFSCAGIFYKPVSESLGVGVGLFGIYMSVMYVAATLFLPFAGKLLERYSARWLFAGSSALMGLVFLAFAALNAVWEFYAVAVALGVSVAFQLYLSFPTLVNRWFSVKVGLMMGICTAASGIGGMLFSPLIALMITDWGWRWAYAACGLLILCVVSPLLALLLRSRPEEKGLRKYGEGSAAPMRVPNATPAKGDNSQTGKGRTGSASIQGSVTYAQAVRMPVFYGVLLFSFLMMAVSTLNLFIPNYFDSLGYTLEQASYAAAAVMAGVTVGKLLLGHINDRNTLFGVLLSTLGGALGLVALVVGGALGLGLSGCVLFGLAYSGVTVQTAMLTRKVFGPEHYARIYSMVSIALAAGGALASGGWGLLQEATSYLFIMAAGAVALAICSILGVAALKVRKDAA